MNLKHPNDRPLSNTYPERDRIIVDYLNNALFKTKLITIINNKIRLRGANLNKLIT